MSDYEFMDAPPPPKQGVRRTSTRWDRCILALVAHPGKWAIVARYPKDEKGWASAGSIMQRIKHNDRPNGIRAFREAPATFDAVSRTSKDGKAVEVWATALKEEPT